MNRIPNENLQRYVQKYLLSDWRDFIINNKAKLGLLWGLGRWVLGARRWTLDAWRWVLGAERLALGAGRLALFTIASILLPIPS